MKINLINRKQYIYMNPKTKQGRESYVRYDERANGWCFDFGQAYSTMHFHKDVNDAVYEMSQCTAFGKVSIPKGIFIEDFAE